MPGNGGDGVGWGVEGEMLPCYDPNNGVLLNFATTLYHMYDG